MTPFLTQTVEGGQVDSILLRLMVAAGGIWLLTLIRVARDANARYQSPRGFTLSLCLIALGTPLVGLPIYLAIRPLGYLWQVPSGSKINDGSSCPHCKVSNSGKTKHCTNCGSSCVQPCHKCQASNALSNKYCHACGQKCHPATTVVSK